MKKILMFHPIIAPYRIDMVNELAENFDLTLCLFANNLIEQKFDIARLYDERLKIKPEFLLEKKYNGKPRIYRAIVDAIKTHEPEIILVGEFSMYVWAILLYRFIHRMHYKVISFVDDSKYLIDNRHSLFVSHSVARYITMPFLDQIINVDYRALEWYQQKYGKGVYLPIVSDDVIYRERLQRILPLSEDYINRFCLQKKKVLLFVGRLSQEKNIPMAIDAFLQAKIPDSVFVIIGDGLERENLLKRYGSEESVMFLGRYEGDALYAWYNVAQVFILPSTREAFGAVTNEALLSGCYSFVSERAGSSCLIVNDKNGYVFSPLNVEQLASILQKVMAKTEPLALPTEIKPNLMPKSFKEYMQILISELSTI